MRLSSLARSVVLGLTFALAAPAIGCAVPAGEATGAVETRGQALDVGPAEAPSVSWGYSASGGDLCVIGDVAVGDRDATVPHARVANGDYLATTQEATLFSVLNADFGGNGKSNFRLPDLRAAAPAGKAYFICTSGLYPSPLMSADCVPGSVRWSAASHDRTGMEIADGRIVPIAKYPALFAAIGAQHGGDGVTTFAFPDAQSESPRDIKAYVCTGNVAEP